MDKLHFIRLSDRPWEVMESWDSDRVYKLITFSVGDRLFCFTRAFDGTAWLTELAKYNRETVHNYPRCIGNPGGYEILDQIRLPATGWREAIVAYVAPKGL